MNTKRVVQVVVAVLLVMGVLFGAGVVGFRVGVAQSPQIAEQMAQWRQTMRPPVAPGAPAAPDGAVTPPQNGPFGRGQMGRGQMGQMGRGQMNYGHGAGYGAMPMRGGFGGGLGIIGGLFRLLFGIALFFLVLRLIGRFMWGKRMGWGGGHGWGRHWGGPNGDDVPPHFAEWYRRMRAKETGVKAEDAPAPSEAPKAE